MVNNMFKATPYTTSRNQGVSDLNNQYYGGPTGVGAYNLDKTYGLSARPNQAEVLKNENNKEFYRNIDAKLSGLPKR